MRNLRVSNEEKSNVEESKGAGLGESKEVDSSTSEEKDYEEVESEGELELTGHRRRRCSLFPVVHPLRVHFRRYGALQSRSLERSWPDYSMHLELETWSQIQLAHYFSHSTPRNCRSRCFRGTMNIQDISLCNTLWISDLVHKHLTFRVVRTPLFIRSHILSICSSSPTSTNVPETSLFFRVTVARLPGWRLTRRPAGTRWYCPSLKTSP